MQSQIIYDDQKIDNEFKEYEKIPTSKYLRS